MNVSCRKNLTQYGRDDDSLLNRIESVVWLSKSSTRYAGSEISIRLYRQTVMSVAREARVMPVVVFVMVELAAASTTICTRKVFNAAPAIDERPVAMSRTNRKYWQVLMILQFRDLRDELSCWVDPSGLVWRQARWEAYW